MRERKPRLQNYSLATSVRRKKARERRVERADSTHSDRVTLGSGTEAAQCQSGYWEAYLRSVSH